MKHFLLLTLLPIILLACGDGVDLITKDAVENIASCYEQMETTDDRYIVSLDKHCVDMELGLPTPAPTPTVTENPPVAIPTDAEWELIATLQRNPLRPAEFYLFDEDKDAITRAYTAGKHFIFEIGHENKGRQVNQARYYIIQPEPPFQDKDKDALQLAHEQQTGVKSDKHTYFFPSSGWYVPRGNIFGTGGEATGLSVEFNVYIIDDIDLSNPQIGLAGPNTSIGGGRSFIHEWVRLRVYVSR